MAYPGATSFPSDAMPGEPYGGHTTSTGVKKTRRPRIKGTVAPKVKHVVVKRHKRRVVSQPKAPRAPKAPASPSEDALLQAATRLRFGPQEQALQGQLNQNAAYGAGLGDWFKNAQAEIAALQGQGRANAQQTLGQITNYTSNPALPNGRDQQAATARNNLNAEFGAQFGQGAEANSAAMDRLRAAMQIQQGNTVAQANTDRQRLLAAQGALEGQKGDFAITYGAQRDAAQAKALADQQKINIALKAFGLKEETLHNVQEPLAQSLTSDRKAKQKVARSRARTQRKQAETQATNPSRQKTQREIDYFDKHGYWPSTGSPKKGKRQQGNFRYSGDEIKTFQDNYDAGKVLASHIKARKNYVDKSTGKSVPITPDVVEVAMLKEYKDADLAKALALTAFGKLVPTKLRHRLAIKGIHLPSPPRGPVTIVRPEVSVR